MNTTYATVSRYAWLWTSGVSASTAGWAYVAGMHSQATLFGAFSAILMLAFVGLK